MPKISSIDMCDIHEEIWHHLFFWLIESGKTEWLGLGKLSLYGKDIEDRPENVEAGKYKGAHKRQKIRFGKWSIEKNEFDILLTAEDGRLVCIEMKTAASTRGAGQALKYLNDLKKLSIAEGRDLHPVIVFVCREVDPHFAAAFNEMPKHVRLITFSLNENEIMLYEVEKEFIWHGDP